MIEIVENKLFYGNRSSVYCYDCRTQMSFNGKGYECSTCGFEYNERASE